MLPAQYFLLPHPSKHSLVYQLVFLTFSPPRVIQVALLEVKVVCTKRHQIFLLFSPDNTLPFGLPTFLGFLIGTSHFCQHLPGEIFDAIHSVSHDGWLNSTKVKHHSYTCKCLFFQVCLASVQQSMVQMFPPFLSPQAALRSCRKVT